MAHRARAIDWRQILLEAAFVVLGVVLALAANEWRRGLADRERARTALHSIRDELATNREGVLESLRYHVALSDTLLVLGGPPGAGAASAARPPDASVFARGFLRPAPLLSTAWDAAAATDVVRHMPYDDVLALSRVYEAQNEYRKQSERAGELIYARLFAEGFEGMVRNHANLKTLLATFWYRECQLIRRYDAALAELGADLAANGAVPPRCEHVPPQ